MTIVNRDEVLIMKMQQAVKSVFFLILGVAIFLLIQDVLTPEWRYPYMMDKPADTIKEFDQLSADSDIQVLFLGTSHSQNSIDPMKIYQETGIATFNLSSSGQSMGLSCFMLQRALQKCSPKYVMLDVSRLFKDDFKDADDNAHYRYIIDSVPLDESKISLASAYTQYFPDNKQLGKFLSVFFPIYEYHSRWTELTASDFKRNIEGNYFSKGYHFYCNISGTDFNVEMMNATAEINHTSTAWFHTIADGVITDNQNVDTKYDPKIAEDSLSYFHKIKELCETNGAKLVLIKIPTLGWPQYYDGAWTRLKSQIVKELAGKYDIPYLDMFYDVDLGIDWGKDTGDGGMHLIYSGAQKVSSFLADYLQNDCHLSENRCQEYEEDLATYQAVSQVANLKSTLQLTDYLKTLSDWDGITVFLSAGNDMMANLSSESRQALNAFGLQTDFDTLSYSDSFLAVKENGVVRYEASSNRLISKEGILENGSIYTITSCGWRTGWQSKIIVDGIDYSRNSLGLNIVVYENSTGLVLDSVTFNTFAPGAQPGERNAFDTNRYLREYEEYLMHNDIRNGVGQ